MLLYFGYNEGIFNRQYILLTNRVDLLFLGEVAFIKMLKQINIIFHNGSWGLLLSRGLRQLPKSPIWLS
jgi:hypothetical protein